MISERIGRRLVVRDEDGSLHPPGAGPAIRIIEPDGSECTAIARGDGFDLYFGRKVITNVSVTPRTAMRLARWLVWWWVVHTWFGLKLRLWDWVRLRALEHRWKSDG